MIDLEQLSDKAQEFLDQFVVSGTDDELFASGYLRGHVDLIIGSALVNQETLTLEQIVEKIVGSIDQAIKNGELEQNDVDVVNNVLNQLIIDFKA